MQGKPIIYPNAKIGKGTKIWHYALIRSGTVIGKNCVIGSGVILDGDVTIGNNVKIQSGAYLPPKTVIKDNVFIAPRVVFTNDKHPPNPNKEDWQGVVVEQEAVICANATLIAGVKIGRGALIAAGAVLTHDAPPNSVWMGNPARDITLIPHLYECEICHQEISQELFIERFLWQNGLKWKQKMEKLSEG